MVVRAQLCRPRPRRIGPAGRGPPRHVTRGPLPEEPRRFATLQARVPEPPPRRGAASPGPSPIRVCRPSRSARPCGRGPLRTSPPPLQAEAGFGGAGPRTLRADGRPGPAIPSPAGSRPGPEYRCFPAGRLIAPSRSAASRSVPASGLHRAGLPSRVEGPSAPGRRGRRRPRRDRRRNGEAPSASQTPKHLIFDSGLTRRASVASRVRIFPCRTGSGLSCRQSAGSKCRPPPANHRRCRPCRRCSRYTKGDFGPRIRVSGPGRAWPLTTRRVARVHGAASAAGGPPVAPSRRRALELRRAREHSVQDDSGAVQKTENS